MVSIFAAKAAPRALAATATLFGGAIVNDGILTLVSNTGDAGSTNDASGATFSDTGVTTFSSITQLSAEFNVTDDDCSFGSPRSQIRVDTPSVVEDKNGLRTPRSHPDSPRRLRREHVALHGQPDRSTTNGQYDTSQIQPGGTQQVSTYAQALALVGTYPVTGICWSSTWPGRPPTRSRPSSCGMSGSTPRLLSHGRDHTTYNGLNPAQACAVAHRHGCDASGSSTARTRTAPTRTASVSRRWPA